MTSRNDDKFTKEAWIDFKTLLNYVPDPEKYIAGPMGWIKRGSGTLLIGGTGLGKSVLAEQMACCLAAGLPILGKISVPKPVRVLYVEAENGLDVLSRDIPSIVRYLKANQKLITQNLRVIHRWQSKDEEFAQYLLDAMTLWQPDVVIVDNYQAYTLGDINKVETFRSWIKGIEQMMHVLQFALVIVAHTPKPRETDAALFSQSQTGIYKAAGSSAMANWARTSCVLEACGKDEKMYRLLLSKSYQWAGIRNADGRCVPVIHLKQSPNPEEPYWVETEETPTTVKDDEAARLRAAVLELRSKNDKLSLRDIADMLKVSPSKVHRSLKSSDAETVVLKKKGAKG